MFYKSTNPVYETIKNYSEEELVRVALYDIEKSLGIKGEPEVVEVTNWKDLMPKYHLEHNQALQTLQEKMMNLYPNIYLAGASYYGVGIGACIGNGKNIANEIIATLNEPSN